MPLDPSIPLSVKPIQLPDPLEMFSAIEQVKGQREAAELRRLAAEEARQRGLEAKQERAEKKQLNELYADAVTVDPVNGHVSYNREKLLAKAPPHLVPTLLDQLEKDEVRMNTLIKSGLDVDHARRLWLAEEAPDVIDAQGDPEVWKTTLLRARQTNSIDQATYDREVTLTDPAQILTRAQNWVKRATKPGESFTLNAGEVRFGPTGNVIARGEPKPAEHSTAYKEWQDYKATGGTLGFNEYMTEDANRKAVRVSVGGNEPIAAVIGPDGKPVYVTRSQAIGKTPASTGGETGLKLTGAQQEDISTMLTVQDLSKSALTLGDQIKWRGTGPVGARVGSVAAQFGRGGEDSERLRNLIGNIQGTIAKLRGGTAFSAQEQKMLESYTPVPEDSVLKIKAKLKSLNEFIVAKRENMLRVAGGEYRPRDTDKKTTADPMGIR